VLKVEEYSAIEAMRDGCRVEIRALRPDDRADLISALGRTSDQSLYRRFFGLKRSFTDKEAAFFVNVDFVNHVALRAFSIAMTAWAAKFCDSVICLCENGRTSRR
jgi:hypothetical protein